jgi:alpha-N-arabinofuranosidase
MAQIRIDPDRKLGPVDRRIFGSFIEHLGRCIYGGVFEPGSKLADENGFRRDVLDAARRLRTPLLRWPGGNFVSGYHWTDGIGPSDRRPRRSELAWHAEESNLFGTDEFIRYCRALGAEPYICVNMGSGSMDEAQAWVEYCNGSGNTYWANMRRANGSDEPYNVKLWGLGNELYGSWQIGSTSAEDYVKKGRQFAAVMLLTDPSIELVSCGQWGWTDWDRIVLDGLAQFVRYHSVHIYTGSPDYYTNVLEPHKSDQALRICESLIERTRLAQKIDHSIGIAYDEWNVWYRTRRTQALRNAGLEEQYDLADALAVATFLNIFIRHCRSVTLANYAQMVNVIAPIFTRPDGLFLQTVYHPLRLYAEHAQAVALDAFVDSPLLEVPSVSAEVRELGPFQSLDVAATCDVDGREVCISVVNRHHDQAVTARVEVLGAFDGPVEIHEVNAADVSATNSFEEPELVGVRSRQLESAGSTFEHAFPAHSLTVIRARLTAAAG